jgi:2-amino-4-hydroxy-6-hydroxymethyldihydropteridine diphosphokinase
MTRAYIGLGSNLGDREESLRRALAMLGDSARVRLGRCAGLYETEPVGLEDQPWFLNTVVEIETSFTPEELLAYCRAIEAGLGRRATGRRGGPRQIDLDILFYADRVMAKPDLQVPHAQLHLRRFVLQPLCELIPDFIHPVHQRPLSQLLATLEDSKQVIPLR